MRILSIDPSVNFVGWTLFDSNKKTDNKRWTWGTINLEGNNYQMKLVALVQELAELVGTPDHLVTEWPTFFSSERGQIAAHQNYTIDLAGVCAYLAGAFGLDHRHWHILTATTWKGSVPKFVTSNKFYRVFRRNRGKISEHAIDSTMLLHFWLKEYGPRVFQRDGATFPESPLWQF